jgi:sucrose-phosphate synthase
VFQLKYLLTPSIPFLLHNFQRLLFEIPFSRITFNSLISTNDGGPKEIRSKCENGLLVDVTDINELKVILEKGISNNAQWKLWSRNGIEGVNRHFSWNTHVRNYLSILTEEFSRSNSYSSSDIKQSCLKGSSSLIKPH